MKLRLCKSTAEIDDILETITLEGACRKIAALALLAVNENPSVAGKFVKAVAEFIERRVRRQSTPGCPPSFENKPGTDGS